jgi:Transposase IS4
VAMRLIRSFNE